MFQFLKTTVKSPINNVINTQKNQSNEESKKDGKNENTDDENSEDNNSDDENNIDQKLLQCIFNKKIYSNSYFEVYICSARDLCISIPIWSSNRPLDLNHVQKLSEDIYTEKHIIGTFKIMTDSTEYRIFDGQHRYFALRKVFENDLKFDIEVLVELYKVKNFDDSNSVFLFSKANNVKNIDCNELPNLTAHNTMKLLKENFGESFVESVNKVNRPKINHREFYLKLKSILDENSKKLSHNFPRTSDEIFSCINNLNKQYSLRHPSSFRNITVTMYEKAKKSGFYLGLDKNFENWLNNLQMTKNN